MTVSFKEAICAKVRFSELDNYLANTATEATVNCIEITELSESNLKNEDGYEPSPLAKILQKHNTKKVAIKLGDDTPAITSMQNCFRDCDALTQAPIIPQGVIEMSSCFQGCTSLTKASTIPQSVTNMKSCFQGCTNLSQAPNIPNSVIDMNFCFKACNNLVHSPTIPQSVKNLMYCFSDCSALKSATLRKR